MLTNQLTHWIWKGIWLPLICAFFRSHIIILHPQQCREILQRKWRAKGGGLKILENLLGCDCSADLLYGEKITNRFSVKSLCCNVSNTCLQAIEVLPGWSHFVLYECRFPCSQKWMTSKCFSKMAQSCSCENMHMAVFIHIKKKCVRKSSAAALGSKQPGVGCLWPLDSISRCVLPIHPFPDTWWTSESNQSSREHDHKRESWSGNQTRGLQQDEV